MERGEKQLRSFCLSNSKTKSKQPYEPQLAPRLSWNYVSITHVSPDTQGDPFCLLVNTLGLGVRAAPRILQGPHHAPGTARAQTMWFSQSRSPFFPKSLILTDEGTSYVRATDHPEGLGGRDGRDNYHQEKTVYKDWPRRISNLLTPLRGRPLGIRWSLAIERYSALLRG